MKLEQSINQREIEEKYKNKITERDLTIQELRDMKSKLSTKMVGETLEIHCETQFNLCLLYTSPSPRDRTRSRMPSSA